MVECIDFKLEGNLVTGDWAPFLGVRRDEGGAAYNSIITTTLGLFIPLPKWHSRQANEKGYLV